MKYTRTKLINICEKAIVDEVKWTNRDSAKSQIGIGTALVLLKANCEFEIKTKDNTKDGSGCITNDETIWIQFYVKDFAYFEWLEDRERGNADLDYHFYLPTMKRLRKAKGGDWY